MWSFYYIRGSWGDEIIFCCFIGPCVTRRWALHVVVRRHFFTFIICSVSTSIFNPQPWYQYSAFENKWPLCWNYTCGFDLALLTSSVCDSASACKFYPNQTIVNGIVTSCRSPRWRQRRRKSTSAFSFGDVLHLRTSKSIRIPNFAKIAQSAADILLFPVSENKRPPYWNSISGSTLSFPSSLTCDSRSACQISSESDNWRPSYDV